MEFDKLSKTQKIAYWIEVENDINQCLTLCGDNVPIDIFDEVNEYLLHNELGIAIELLVCAVIENKWAIPDDAKDNILITLEKMGYKKSDLEEYQRYVKGLNAI